MPLSAGDKLGSYEILGPIGAGGMGEVYRARDTQLDREVAIKVLPSALAGDPERLARFEREAKVLASLNHPSIAQIYATAEAGGIRALIMELVPGETLKGPLSLPQALLVAQQIADALQAAHDKGIVHRDLKPANIIITPQGLAKVLDFGLAKLTESVVSGGDPRNSPTLTMGATQAGMVMGTAAYMAPEQARGQQDVDRRADIWAFGVVLYEMLTGKQLFHGDTTSDILASVLRAEPDLAQIPPKLQPLLRSCLQKDPQRRLQAIGDWMLLVGGAPTSASSRGKSRLRNFAGLAATLLAVIAIAGWTWWRSTRPVEHPLMWLSVDLGPDAVTSTEITVAISHDGTRLVFPVRARDGKQQLATRLLDQKVATVLPGTDGASDPFFSPDGQWVGFFADGKMKKISVLGGAPVTLCDAGRGWGGSWGEDGTIIAALSTISTGLSRVSAAGGTPQNMTPMVGVRTNERWPQVLPGGKAVLLTASNSLSTFQYATIEAVSLRSGQRKTLVRDAYFGRYFSDGRSGYLVYIHDNALFAVPFDPDQMNLSGTATQVVEDLAGDQASGAGQFDFSQTGTLVYRSGKVPDQVWPVEWLDSSGKLSPLLGAPAAYTTPRFSPDGQRLALVIGQSRGREILIYDWRRDAPLRLTSAIQGNSSLCPVWAPDGKHIAYRSAPSPGGSSIEWLRSDGSGVGQRLFESKNLVQPYSFSPDGRLLAYFQVSPGIGADIWTIRLDLTDPDHPKTGKPEVFVSSPSLKLHPAFSPDGRWMAYASNESGGLEIYVRSLSASAGQWLISTSGGMHPMWSRNGRELFYTNADSRIMVADYEAVGDSFKPGKPRLWSNTQIRDQGGITNLDLTPDGKRFAVFPMPEASVRSDSVHLTLLLNFFDEVRRKVPAEK